MEKTTKSKKRIKNLPVTGQFFTADASLNEKFVTVKLPSSVAQYLGLTDSKVFWTPINGVIQLSAGQPNIVIPLMSVGADQFVSHS